VQRYSCLEYLTILKNGYFAGIYARASALRHPESGRLAKDVVCGKKKLSKNFIHEADKDECE